MKEFRFLTDSRGVAKVDLKTLRASWEEMLQDEPTRTAVLKAAKSGMLKDGAWTFLRMWLVGEPFRIVSANNTSSMSETERVIGLLNKWIVKELRCR